MIDYVHMSDLLLHISVVATYIWYGIQRNPWSEYVIKEKMLSQIVNTSTCPVCKHQSYIHYALSQQTYNINT